MAEPTTIESTPAPETVPTPTPSPAPAPQTIESKVFDETYVKNLRDEAANYRVKAKELETKNTEFNSKIEALQAQTRNATLKAAVAASTHKVVSVEDALALMDKSAIKFSDATGEPENLDELLQKLIEAKPYLAGNSAAPTSATSPGRTNSTETLDAQFAATGRRNSFRL